MLLFFFLACTPNMKAQIISYGAHGALAYSQIVLSNNHLPYSTTGSSIGFQAGFFFRRDFKRFFLLTEANYTGNVGGTYVYHSDEMDQKVSFLSVPVIIGKIFFPGIRIFTGLVPCLTLSLNNEQTFYDFTEGVIDELAPSGGSSGHGEFRPGIDVLFGAGIEISKIFLNIRYERGFIGGFRDDFYEPQSAPYVENRHRISMICLGLAIRLN